MTPLNKMTKANKATAIYHMECAFLETQCLASQLFEVEMKKRNVMNDPNLLAALQHLKNIESEQGHQIHLKWNKELLPLLHKLLKQKEKLEQKHKDQLGNLVYSPYPLRRIQTEELALSQESETREMAKKHSKRIAAFSDEIETIQKQHRRDIYVIFQKYIRQLYK